MELKVDTNELMKAALAHAFSQADPSALAVAMAETMLEKEKGYGSKTVLDQVIQTAVTNLAKETVSAIFVERRTELIELIKTKISDDVIEQAATVLYQRMMGIRSA